MKTKSIVFVEKNKARLIEENLCEMTDNDVLVRIEVSAISSGTERANIIGEKNVAGNSDEIRPFPRRCGYSAAGVVEKTGNNITKVKSGDRVAVFGKCHSRYIIVSENNLVIIKSNDIPFEEASLWYISTFSLAAVRKCALEIGESSIVMGLGVLGMMAVMLLKAAGAAPVIAVDPILQKRTKALEVGADYAFDPFAEDFADQVKNITGGGTNVAIEVTGNGQALIQVLDCMAKFGRVALLGCTRNSNFTIDYYKKVHAPGISLIGAHTSARPAKESSHGLWTDYDDMEAVQKLVNYGRLNFSSLIGEIHSPEEASRIYDRLINEKTFPVVLFDWRTL